MEEECKACFEDMYDQIMQESKNELQGYRSLIVRFLTTMVIILIIVCTAMKTLRGYREYFTVAVAVSAASVLIVFFQAHKLLNRKYKKIIIRNMIRFYRPNAEYLFKKGISRQEFDNARFEENYSDFISEDYISDLLKTGEKLEVSDIVINDQVKNQDNTVDVKTRFTGLFGIVYLDRKINNEINMMVDSNDKLFDKDRVEVDSAEFENYFDLTSTDRVVALQIYTSDVIEKILELKRIAKKNILEIKIKQNRVYFRYEYYNAFESPDIRIGLTKDYLYTQFRLFFYPIEILEAIADNISRYVALSDIPDYEENDPIKNL